MSEYHERFGLGWNEEDGKIHYFVRDFSAGEDLSLLDVGVIERIIKLLNRLDELTETTRSL